MIGAHYGPGGIIKPNAHMAGVGEGDHRIVGNNAHMGGRFNGGVHHRQREPVLGEEGRMKYEAVDINMQRKAQDYYYKKKLKEDRIKEKRKEGKQSGGLFACCFGKRKAKNPAQRMAKREEGKQAERNEAPQHPYSNGEAHVGNPEDNKREMPEQIYSHQNLDDSNSYNHQ